jgi:hypothetical protein
VKWRRMPMPVCSGARAMRSSEMGGERTGREVRPGRISGEDQHRATRACGERPAGPQDVGRNYSRVTTPSRAHMVNNPRPPILPPLAPGGRCAAPRRRRCGARDAAVGATGASATVAPPGTGPDPAPVRRPGADSQVEVEPLPDDGNGTHLRSRSAHHRQRKRQPPFRSSAPGHSARRATYGPDAVDF